MNRIVFILLALVAVGAILTTPASATAALAGGPGVAQVSGEAAKGSSQQTSPPAPEAPRQAAPAAPPPGRPQPQAKTEDEYKAYQETMAKAKPEEVEVAANQFAIKFPESELRTLIYHRAMTLYQAANSAEKVVEMGRKILAIDANNPVALVMVAAVLSENTHETDPKRDQLLSEAATDAQHALQTIDTDLSIPPNTPPAKVEEYRNMLRVMAYEAVGMVDFGKNNFAAAEPNLRKATQIAVPDPDPYNFLRLAIVLDRQNKYQDAMSAADRALQLSPANSQPAKYAQQEKDRLSKLVGTPSPAGAPSAAPPPRP